MIVQSVLLIISVLCVWSLQDPSVTQLTQDLAKILGLKIRKAYVRSKVCVCDLKPP